MLNSFSPLPESLTSVLSGWFQNSITVCFSERRYAILEHLSCQVFPPCPTWVPVSSCLALSLDSTDPFLRSTRRLSADDQGVILNAREILGCEWKLAWAFQVEHVPLLRHTEVKVLFLSMCTHVHTCARWISSSLDRSTLWDVVYLFYFFSFLF